jgi:hypothetical protein
MVLAYDYEWNCGYIRLLSKGYRRLYPRRYSGNAEFDNEKTKPPKPHMTSKA